MKKYKKLYFFMGIFILILVVLSQLHAPEESLQAKNSRLNYICYFTMKRIGVALLEYAEKEGNGSFPEDISILVEKKYLPGKDCFFCGAQKDVPYYYFPGLCKDMPHNIPILIEKNAPHIDNRTGKKGGFCLFLDFSVRYPLAEGEDIVFIKDTHKALEISKQNSKEFLLKILSEPQHSERVKSMCLWKLRKLEIPVFTTIIPTYLHSKSYAISKEAAYAILPWDKEKASSVLVSFLYDDNYFIRKSIWEKLFPSSQNIDFISSDICELMVNKFLKRN